MPIGSQPPSPPSRRCVARRSARAGGAGSSSATCWNWARTAQREHAAVGDSAGAGRGIDRTVLVGQDTRHTYEAALTARMEPARIAYFPAPLDDREELALAKEKAVALLWRELAPGDLVLVKGSLGVGMDVVVAALTGAETADAGH